MYIKMTELWTGLGILHTLIKKAGADLPDTMKRPYIAQVITFDVLYDDEEAKTEKKMAKFQ